MGLMKFMQVPCCFKPSKKRCSRHRIQDSKQVSIRRLALSDLSNPDSRLSMSDISNSLIVGTDLHIFTLKELQVVTHGFSKNNFLGEGGFGPVYKGFVDGKLRSGLEARAVAVKKLDLDGTQGDREWLAEVIFLGELKHPHLVNLIGYCCEEEHRLLVYEFMERGNLEGQLFGRLTATLPWSTRLKIAVGAAKGLAFLHEGENPVIYRDFKASNILLDVDFNAKVSDFGLATNGPEGDDTHVSTQIMGTRGYAAPEYIMTGHLTAMSDVYSFGVVLLELLTGRRSVDKKCFNREQVNLVNWARPMLKDHHKLDRLMDSKLEGQYSMQGAKRAALVAYQCLSNHPKSRLSMSDVVKTLEPLIDLSYDIPIGPFVYIVPPEVSGQDEETKGEEKEATKKKKRRHHKSSRDRAVHSDNDLYDVLGASLYCPVNLVVKEDRVVLQK